MGGRAAAFAAPGLWPPRAGPTPRPVATVWLQRGIRRMPSAPILAAWHVVRPYTCRVSPPPVWCPFRRRGAPSLGLAPHNPARPQNPRGSCRVPPRRVPALETRDRRVQRARRLAEDAGGARGPRPGRASRAPSPPIPWWHPAAWWCSGAGVGPGPSVRKARREGRRSLEGVSSLHRQPPPWRPSLAGNHATPPERTVTHPCFSGDSAEILVPTRRRLSDTLSAQVTQGPP